MIPNIYQCITIIIMCNLCDILQLDTIVSHNQHTTKHQNCCAGVTFVLRSCNLSLNEAYYCFQHGRTVCRGPDISLNLIWHT